MLPDSEKSVTERALHANVTPVVPPHSSLSATMEGCAHSARLSTRKDADMNAAVLAAVSAASRTPDTLTRTCTDSPGTACRLVWDLTHDGNLSRLTEAYLAGPVSVALRILFVLLLA